MNELPEHSQAEVAVIGVACQFPGSENVDPFLGKFKGRERDYHFLF